MSKRFKLYATIKENAGFQCPNRTFRTIKMRIKKFYRDSWNEEITDKNLIAWKHLLGID